MHYRQRRGSSLMFQPMRKRQATIACRVALYVTESTQESLSDRAPDWPGGRLLGRAALASGDALGVTFTGCLSHQIGRCASHGEGHGHCGQLAVQVLGKIDAGRAGSFRAFGCRGGLGAASGAAVGSSLAIGVADVSGTVATAGVLAGSAASESSSLRRVGCLSRERIAQLDSLGLEPDRMRSISASRSCSASGPNTPSSSASGVSSARRRLRPMRRRCGSMRMIRKSRSSPSETTCLGCDTRSSTSSETWMSPSMPSSMRAKAPKLASCVTVPRTS